ncbi:MAG: hypothetical protein UY76_C0013G0009 [Candidatus Uhrbacteria bacterium GW2011_GWA2_52_8d]|uniref:Uncharacterized protein n=1 Tax=Candidatus Uhrbacteria bacterium GW2011_GWA2_52_8d TaxID=1618979 RepID=A0A0G1XPQ4_9BACT|nr:MAG: hypothetical protein UY76_C0013G0009 [Candidatus Uhrbacteria bacterium GW2011_GWA2_52_8d]
MSEEHIRERQQQACALLQNAVGAPGREIHICNPGDVLGKTCRTIVHGVLVYFRIASIHVEGSGDTMIITLCGGYDDTQYLTESTILW